MTNPDTPMDLRPRFLDLGKIGAGSIYDDHISQLYQQGERLDPTTVDRLDDGVFFHGLQEYCASQNLEISDFLRNTLRFDKIGLLKDGPVSHDRYFQNQDIPSLRRPDYGNLVALDRLQSHGIDPKFVLMFRVTQPATETSKPETYWTSDLTEVRSGLRYEQGSRRHSAVILVSTLAEISRDTDLMTDINDDQGHPVRRISDEPFDQARAMYAFRRNNREVSEDCTYHPESLPIPDPIKHGAAIVQLADNDAAGIVW